MLLKQAKPDKFSTTVVHVPYQVIEKRGHSLILEHTDNGGTLLYELHQHMKIESCRREYQPRYSSIRSRIRRRQTSAQKIFAYHPTTCRFSKLLQYSSSRDNVLLQENISIMFIGRYNYLMSRELCVNFKNGLFSILAFFLIVLFKDLHKDEECTVFE